MMSAASVTSPMCDAFPTAAATEVFANVVGKTSLDAEDQAIAVAVGPSPPSPHSDTSLTHTSILVEAISDRTDAAGQAVLRAPGIQRGLQATCGGVQRVADKANSITEAGLSSVRNAMEHVDGYARPVLLRAGRSCAEGSQVVFASAEGMGEASETKMHAAAASVKTAFPATVDTMSGGILMLKAAADKANNVTEAGLGKFRTIAVRLSEVARPFQVHRPGSSFAKTRGTTKNHQTAQQTVPATDSAPESSDVHVHEIFA